MRNQIRTIYLLLVLSISQFLAAQRFTTEQKIKDFNYMYEVIKDNYPYHGVNQRQYHTNWMLNKEKYLEKIKQTNTDKAYFDALSEIISELHSGHASFYPSREYSMFLNVYTTAIRDDSHYRNWVNELKKKSVVDNHPYWDLLINGKSTDQPISTQTNNENSTVPFPFKLKCLRSGKTAYIQFSSCIFDRNKQLEWRDSLRSFLTSSKSYCDLIIDIQGNGGGDSKSWSDLIVPLLIEKPIKIKSIIALRGKKTKQVMNLSFFNTIKFSSLPYRVNYPAELSTDNYFFVKSASTLKPINATGFKGKIYLLVDKMVYSSAEQFANFCKSTHWATVVGRTTAGDGVGSDPMLVALPESGLIFTIPITGGLNGDGSFNDETKTVPDIKVDGATADERLRNFLKYLDEKSTNTEM